MTSYEISRLLLLLFLIQWDQANGLCSLRKFAAAQCDDLEDARYIDTYQLHVLRAPYFSKTLTPGNFRNLTSLRHLDLSIGHIEKIESGSFAKLSSLQTLNLAENRIDHLEAGAFDGLKNVHSLKLGGNVIKQLPSALMSLKELRLLDISDNPLNCNCASMKLRDVLLARGVKISKKTLCSEPSFAKHASILKPDTKTICISEKQDLEMQGDQPIEDNVEGSGELGEDEILEEIEKDIIYDEKEIDQPKENEKETEVEKETMAPTEVNSSSSEAISAETASVETLSTSTTTAKDDITFEDVEETKEITTIKDFEDVTETSTELVQGVNDDLIYAVREPKISTTKDLVKVSTSIKPKIIDDIIIPNEGSGEFDDYGSGEGSGLIARMPNIDFNETSEGFEEEEVKISSTSTTTTTEGSSWWGIGDIINNLNPWGSFETTEITTATEKNADDDLKEEQFIEVKHTPTTESDIVEDPISPPKVVIPNEGSFKQSPRTSGLPDDGISRSLNTDIDENSVDPAYSQESKKGMGSYVVLATLLAILAALIAFAAYKGDFCRKKRKRRDIERGTEMKDMCKSLLDQNSTQPKVQVLNGNTMENVPLMNSTAPPEEPKDNQRSYDITPEVVTNGSSRPNGSTIELNDPVKPPRKSINQEIEAPLNGLNPPMEDIDAPIRTSLHNGSNEMMNNGDCCERPPLSPGAQRVKITLQENPDSVPKTPILITRLKDGENLVKAP